MKKGKVTKGSDVALLDGVEIQSLETQKFCKYLGMDGKNGINGNYGRLLIINDDYGRKSEKGIFLSCEENIENPAQF